MLVLGNTERSAQNGSSWMTFPYAWDKFRSVLPQGHGACGGVPGTASTPCAARAGGWPPSGDAGDPRAVPRGAAGARRGEQPRLGPPLPSSRSPSKPGGSRTTRGVGDGSGRGRAGWWWSLRWRHRGAGSGRGRWALRPPPPPSSELLSAEPAGVGEWDVTRTTSQKHCAWEPRNEK